MASPANRVADYVMAPQTLSVLDVIIIRLITINCKYTGICTAFLLAITEDLKI